MKWKTTGRERGQEHGECDGEGKGERGSGGLQSGPHSHSPSCSGADGMGRIGGRDECGGVVHVIHTASRQWYSCVFCPLVVVMPFPRLTFSFSSNPPRLAPTHLPCRQRPLSCRASIFFSCRLRRPPRCQVRSEVIQRRVLVNQSAHFCRRWTGPCP